VARDPHARLAPRAEERRAHSILAVKYPATVGGPAADEIITEQLPEMPLDQARRVFEWLANRGTRTARKGPAGAARYLVLGPARPVSWMARIRRGERLRMQLPWRRGSPCR
jgi:hypothetical protein